MTSEKVNISKIMALRRLLKYHYKREKRIVTSRAEITHFLPNDLFFAHVCLSRSITDIWTIVNDTRRLLKPRIILKTFGSWYTFSKIKKLLTEKALTFLNRVPIQRIIVLPQVEISELLIQKLVHVSATAWCQIQVLGMLNAKISS